MVELICTAVLFLAMAGDGACALPPIEEMPALLTVYDTALCDAGELCEQGDGDGYFASTIAVSDEWYGRMAACAPELFGRTIRVLDMELFCGDNFGVWNGEPVETVVYDPELGWHVRVDVFWPVARDGYPDWNYLLVAWEEQ